MNKKCVIKWILFLIVVYIVTFPLNIGFLTTGGSSPFQRKIITVDDEPGDANYTSIKEALNHSSPGDIVEVYSGTYNENYIIIYNDGIVLKGVSHELGNGNDTGKPIIDAQRINIAMGVMGRNVTVTGFRMENGGPQDALVVITNSASNCTLSDNDLKNSKLAIIGCGGNNSKIINNTVEHSDIRQGILLWGNHILVSGNNISYVTEGISIWDAWNCTYIRNTISHCYDYGIVIYGTGYITVSHNTIKENPTGILIDASINNVIEKNNFINNNRQAYFNQELGFTAGNRWIYNYWGQPRLLPYPIRGIVFILIPWIQFDWRPALRPYDIS